MTYPQVFPVIATRPAGAPWIRPPLRSLKWIESFLAALSTSGFSDHQAVEAYQAFSSFLLGNLLLHVSLDEESEGSDSMTHERSQDALKEFPHIQRMQSLLAKSWNEQEFEMALEDVLNRIGLLKT